MSKIFFCALLLGVVSASFAKVEVTTKLSVLKEGVTVRKLDGEAKTILKASLPDDDGWSNWGDQVYSKRQSIDELLLRDLVVYPIKSTSDQNLKYTASFSNVKSISSVRFLNIGRERAYAGEIDVSSDEVEIYFTLPAERDPRVLIEVYGFK